MKKKKKREGEGKKKRKLTAANSVAVIVGENRFQLGDRQREKKKKEERRARRGSLFRVEFESNGRLSRQSLSLSISVYKLSPLCAFLYFILHVRRCDARRRKILDGDFCKVLRSLNSSQRFNQIFRESNFSFLSCSCPVLESSQRDSTTPSIPTHGRGLSPPRDKP